MRIRGGLTKSHFTKPDCAFLILSKPFMGKDLGGYRS
jgi:hypothetical protein